MSLRSPLGRVLGLGAAKKGSSHWWLQRVSSVALAVLTLWLWAALLMLGTLDYEAVIAWMRSPINAALLTLLVLTAAYHSQLGVQVVVEDYIAHHGGKLVVMILVNFIHVALGAIGLFAILRVAFGGAA